MRRFVVVLGLAVAACSSIVGIRDVVEDTGDGSAPVIVDAASGDDARLDADAPVDAGPLVLTGGTVHFLQPAESVTLELAAASGPSPLVLTKNGDFELPARASSVRVVASPPGRRCWSRLAAADRVDVRCVFAARVVVEPAETESTTYTSIPGAISKVVTDLPSSTLLVAYSMPYASTSGPEAAYPDYSTLLVRAVVDGDLDHAIELRRGSTFWHQPASQTLLATVDVGPGTHTIQLEYAHTEPKLIAGRKAYVGGSQLDLTYRSELLTVGLESIASYRKVLRTPVTSDVALADKNTWVPLTSLSGTADTPAQAFVMAYYPDVFFPRLDDPSAASGYFTLVSGQSPGTTLVSHTMKHVMDDNGHRSIALTAAVDVSGPFSFRVDHRTELGPNLVKGGGALTALLFAGDADLQSFGFVGDRDFAGPVGVFQTIPATTFQVRSRTSKALVFLDTNLFTITDAGYAAEVQLVDNGKPLLSAFVQSWLWEYGQGSNVATLADFSGGPHELSIRVRQIAGAITQTTRMLHSLVPDGRGRSLVTIVPLE